MSEDKKYVQVKGPTIAKFVAANPGLLFEKLVEAVAEAETGDPIKVRDMVYYLKSINAVSISKSRIVSLGDNEVWLVRHGIAVGAATTLIKPLVSSQISAPILNKIQEDLAEVLADEPTSKNAAEVESIPAFLLKSEVLESAEAEATLAIEIPGTLESTGPRFKLALTSDKTLMVWGLTAEPLELNVDQTEILIDFIDSTAFGLPEQAYTRAAI